MSDGSEAATVDGHLLHHDPDEALRIVTDAASRWMDEHGPTLPDGRSVFLALLDLDALTP